MHNYLLTKIEQWCIVKIVYIACKMIYLLSLLSVFMFCEVSASAATAASGAGDTETPRHPPRKADDGGTLFYDDSGRLFGYAAPSAPTIVERLTPQNWTECQKKIDPKLWQKIPAQRKIVFFVLERGGLLEKYLSSRTGNPGLKVSEFLRQKHPGRFSWVSCSVNDILTELNDTLAERIHDLEFPETKPKHADGSTLVLPPGRTESTDAREHADTTPAAAAKPAL